MVEQTRKIRLPFFRARIVSLMLCALLINSGYAAAADPADDAQFDTGKRALNARAGCYLVDYSFVENEAVKPGYNTDHRVYDVNREKSVKEWIFVEPLSATRFKLQHVLFATDLKGKQKEGSVLKHTAEDWEYNAPFLYDYAGHSKWTVKDLKATPHLWTRRVTNLDDGLRYQCAAAFNLSNSYPDWSCDGYAPIPGRETRDMGRKDYQGLQRSSRIIVYGTNWLERERNVKTIESSDAKTPLAKEVGKTWYVRLPDSECSEAQDFVKPRLPFWLLLGQTWDKVLNGQDSFEEPAPPPHPSRYEKIMDVADEYLNKDIADAANHEAAEKALLKIISDSRKNDATPGQGEKH